MTLPPTVLSPSTRRTPRVPRRPVFVRPSSPLLDPQKLLDDATQNEVLHPEIHPHPDYSIEPIHCIESHFRHSGWLSNRRRVFAALQRTSATSIRQGAFANCGSAAYVEQNKADGTLRLVGNHCHDRFCVPCGNARGAMIADRLHAAAKGKTVRFATFTLRHSQTPLCDQITRLYDSFAKLRRLSWFKLKCPGGAAVLEVKLGAGRLWHVHLHCLLLGEFIPQFDLAAAWHAITGDSYIVDIQRIPDQGPVIRYVTKYVGKPCDSTVYADAERLDELIIAMKGRRLINTWGAWSKVDLKPEKQDKSAWKPIGRLVDILRDAAAGIASATAILRALVAGKSYTAPLSYSG